MARFFDDAATQSLDSSTTPITAAPFTMDAWVYTVDTGRRRTIFAVWRGSNEYWLLHLNGADEPGLFMEAGGVPDEAVCSTTVGALKWAHVTGVVASSTDRRVFVHGGNKGTSAVDLTPLASTGLLVGGRVDNYWMHGAIAEIVLRRSALTDSEVAVLPYVPPWKVRPSSIVGYWPFRYGRTWDRDIGGRGYHMSPVNPPTWAPHPQQAQKYWFDAEMRKHRRWPTKNKPIYPAEIVWGHDTGVAESIVRNFQFNWTGTGGLQQAGQIDVESLELSAGEYMISEIVDTGNVDIQILYNVYIAGDAIDLDYRHGATLDACEAAAWNNYVGAFTSLGYAQVRVTSTL